MRVGGARPEPPHAGQARDSRRARTARRRCSATRSGACRCQRTMPTTIPGQGPPIGRSRRCRRACTYPYPARERVGPAASRCWSSRSSLPRDATSTALVPPTPYNGMPVLRRSSTHRADAVAPHQADPRWCRARAVRRDRDGRDHQGRRRSTDAAAARQRPRRRRARATTSRSRPTTSRKTEATPKTPRTAKTTRPSRRDPPKVEPPKTEPEDRAADDGRRPRSIRPRSSRRSRSPSRRTRRRKRRRRRSPKVKKPDAAKVAEEGPPKRKRRRQAREGRQGPPPKQDRQPKKDRRQEATSTPTTSGAKAKADELYRSKKFNEAASRAQRAAASGRSDDASELKSLAGVYEQFGRHVQRRHGAGHDARRRVAALEARDELRHTAGARSATEINAEARARSRRRPRSRSPREELREAAIGGRGRREPRQQDRRHQDAREHPRVRQPASSTTRQPEEIDSDPRRGEVQAPPDQGHGRLDRARGIRRPRSCSAAADGYCRRRRVAITFSRRSNSNGLSMCASAP